MNVLSNIHVNTYCVLLVITQIHCFIPIVTYTTLHEFAWRFLALKQSSIHQQGRSKVRLRIHQVRRTATGFFLKRKKKGTLGRIVVSPYGHAPCFQSCLQNADIAKAWEDLPPGGTGTYMYVLTYIMCAVVPWLYSMNSTWFVGPSGIALF